MFGKWHLGFDEAAFAGERGFDYRYDVGAAGLSGVVVVASDNGSPDARGFAGNLPLRGQKHGCGGGVRVRPSSSGASVPVAAAQRRRGRRLVADARQARGRASSADASLDGVDLARRRRGDDVRSELLHN
ncbi:hypothetical protein JL721_12053 [Aureococcus anophagefferens]|nr:hypothetical protein JL721_12053 [Aureococcus anophagefferens]